MPLPLLALIKKVVVVAGRQVEAVVEAVTTLT